MAAGTKRLDKFLSDAGVGTRSEVKTLIRKGRVAVDGQKQTSPDYKVSGEEDIRFDGCPVGRAPEYLYFVLNKPAGVITATEDRTQRTVMEFLPKDHPFLTEARRKKMFPVGRLDKDTEGLLLITDDGALAHDLLSPGKHVEKEYIAGIEGTLCEDAEERFREGMDIGDDTKTLPAELIRESDTIVRVILSEGRFHQVKRMIAACGARVVSLKRVRMGRLVLPEGLGPGECVEV